MSATLELKTATLAEMLSASDAEIAAALAKVAREIMRRRRIHWRRDERHGVTPTFKLMSASELFDTPLPSRRQSRLLALVEKADDPVLAALENAIRDFGELLAETGDTDRMRRVCEMAAGRSRKDGYRWLDIFDKRWDGIVARDGDIWVA
jgi:hypothetical protein